MKSSASRNVVKKKAVTSHSTPKFAVCLIVLGLLSDLGLADAANLPQKILLFDSGKEGYPRYRIPSLIVAPNGDVLALCEGRKDGGGLTGNIDLVMRRSTDGGKTWGALEVIADDGSNTLGNPCAVIDRGTKTIWLAFTRSLGEDTEDEIVKGTSKERTRVLITSSKDNGKTWSKHIDITKDTKRPEWTWYGTGPGVGIQLKSGRLFIPSYHADAKTQIYRSHAIFSDDHGRTWKLGGVVGDHTSECHVAERKDGSIYLNARTIKGTELRTIATSKDGGATWSKPKFEQALYDPHCQACVYVLPKLKSDDPSRWLFTGPSGPGRHNLKVHVSNDEGHSWPIAKRLHEGDSQYSCLTKLPDGMIGCLYESWQNGNYRLYFARFEL